MFSPLFVLYCSVVSLEIQTPSGQELSRALELCVKLPKQKTAKMKQFWGQFDPFVDFVCAVVCTALPCSMGGDEGFVRGKAPSGRTCGSVGSLINSVYLCSLFFFNHRQMRELWGRRRGHVYVATSVKTPEGVPPFIMLIVFVLDYVPKKRN